MNLGPWGATTNGDPPDATEEIEHALRVRLADILFTDTQRQSLRTLKTRASARTLTPTQIQDAIAFLAGALLRE